MTSLQSVPMDELASSSSKVSVASTRVRDKTATLERLQSSMLRVMDSGRRLSIKAVAEEAGVTPSLIHHVYPDVAEQIRATMGRSTRAQRDAKHDKLVEAKRMISDQKAELRELRADLASIASVNLQLQDRIDELEAQLEGKLAPIRL